MRKRYENNEKLQTNAQKSFAKRQRGAFAEKNVYQRHGSMRKSKAEMAPQKSHLISERLRD
jgi:hypothetical protein